MADKLQEQITISLVEGKLPCASAFKIAGKDKLEPKVVGDKADEMGVRIVGCQLGCFGVAKATHAELAGKPIDSKVAGALNSVQTGGHIDCAAAWETAGKLDVSKRVVGDTATQLKVKISNCQLGCF